MDLLWTAENKSMGERELAADVNRDSGDGIAGKRSSAAKQRNGLRGHDFRRGSHRRGEEVEASSPRRTSTAEKELGGHCAWLATADGGANSLGKGGSTKVATGARGRSREATRLGQYLWRTDLGRHGSEAWRGDMGLLGGGGESGSGTTGGKGRPRHAGPARQSQRGQDVCMA